MRITYVETFRAPEGRAVFDSHCYTPFGAEVTKLEFLATLESVFTFDGLAGHEIALVYSAHLADPALYRQPIITGAEPDGTPITAVWKPLDDFRTGCDPLYPEGLLELLDE